MVGLQILVVAVVALQPAAMLDLTSLSNFCCGPTVHAPAVIALAKRRAREVKVGAVPAVAERGAALVLLDLVVFCYPVDGDGSDVLKSVRCDKNVMQLCRDPFRPDLEGHLHPAKGLL